jgi:hypothetical protein
MADWIATHHPHTLAGSNWFIYLRKRRDDAPVRGDRILFYETLSPEEGTDKQGRGEIVCAGVVTTGNQEPRNPPRSGWEIEIKCRVTVNCLSIPLKTIRKTVDGPFYRQSVRRLDEGDYDDLIR